MNYLLNYGKRIQKSVYYCLIRPEELKEIKKEVKKIIKSGEDRVRYWEICKNCNDTFEIYGINVNLEEDDEYIIV